MRNDDLQETLTQVIADLRLLDHPFYKRWEAGELDAGELGRYATQYRFFEAFIPDYLESIMGAIGQDASLQGASAALNLIESNLADERGNPVPHVELFDQFAVAVGAYANGQTDPSPAILSLLDSYADALSKGAAAALGAFCAYEMQSSEIASSKGDGLRRHYGADSSTTEFWDLHAKIDLDHADWTRQALESLIASSDQPDATRTEVLTSARDSAQAWWKFLDEREACRIAA